MNGTSFIGSDLLLRRKRASTDGETSTERSFNDKFFVQTCCPLGATFLRPLSRSGSTTPTSSASAPLSRTAPGRWCSRTTPLYPLPATTNTLPTATDGSATNAWSGSTGTSSGRRWRRRWSCYTPFATTWTATCKRPATIPRSPFMRFRYSFVAVDDYDFRRRLDRGDVDQLTYIVDYWKFPSALLVFLSDGSCQVCTFPGTILDY